MAQDQKAQSAEACRCGKAEEDPTESDGEGEEAQRLARALFQIDAEFGGEDNMEALKRGHGFVSDTEASDVVSS